jgi:dTDP-4-dehydrorhamnose 3,5-epimerase
LKFNRTRLAGAFVIEPERLEDERGFFARSWCEREARAHGLYPTWVQCNISFNKHQGTLRGMHYQTPPFEEAKLVRCTRGAVYDVIIDLRAESASFKEWLAAELSAENHRLLYVPEGFAHGFFTLSDNTEIFYQMSEFYSPAHARGVRWNDPAFGIEWPGVVRVISDNDRGYPDFFHYKESLPTGGPRAS